VIGARTAALFVAFVGACAGLAEVSAHAAVSAPAAGLVREDLAALEKKLASSQPRERREVVQALAKDASSAAWMLVVGALRDADAMVADEAELALGGLSDPAAIEALLGKEGLGSGTPRVRVRAAEALGRAGVELDATALAKKLGDKDAELRAMCAWSLERLAIAKRIAAKSKHFVQQELESAARKDKDPRVRASAFCARHAIEPWTVSDLVGPLQKKEDTLVRAAAIGLLGRAEFGQLLGVVYRSFDTEGVPARRTLAAASLADGSALAARLLVSMLGLEQNTRAREELVSALRAISGKLLGSEVTVWKEWLAGLPEDWKSARSTKPVTAPEPKRDPPPGGTTSVFMGMPMRSQHVALLFDFSGSMWEKQADGKTRKEALEPELARSLENLPEGTEFNLIPYTATPISWEKGLVTASKPNVQRALAFFADCKARGAGDLWGAVQQALLDPKVDTLLVFSDGAPSGGAYWNLDLLRDVLAQENRFRRVWIDAVIVGAKPYLVERWKEICAASGGELVTLEAK
jgi:HEAT repeat protein